MTTSPAPILRLGLIGPGEIADQRLVPALAELRDVALWSVLSRDRDRGLAFATKHAARSPAPAHTELASFLADPDLDAVIIATPDRLHAAQAIAAAQAGKNVFVEKPMAVTVEEASAIRDACAANGRKLTVGYHLRWHAGHRLLAEKIRAGELGTLYHARVQWTFTGDPSNWRAGPDVGRWWALAAVGTHAIDLLYWLMGTSCGPIVELHCLRTHAFLPSSHDQTDLVAMRFASGATAEIMVSVLFKAPRTVEIYGSKASAVCQGTLGPHGEGKIILNGQNLPFTPANPYVGELADFVAAIREDRNPEADGDVGVANVELLTRADQAFAPSTESP